MVMRGLEAFGIRHILPAVLGNIDFFFKIRPEGDDSLEPNLII
jgi:hypothetical protein